MMVARTGTVSRMNRLRMLGFSLRLGLKVCFIRPSITPRRSSYSNPESGVQRRPLEVPIGRLLIGVAGAEDIRLAEGARHDLEADRQPLVRHATRQGQRRMATHVERRGEAQTRGHRVG